MCKVLRYLLILLQVSTCCYCCLFTDVTDVVGCVEAADSLAKYCSQPEQDQVILWLPEVAHSSDLEICKFFSKKCVLEGKLLTRKTVNLNHVLYHVLKQKSVEV